MEGPARTCDDEAVQACGCASQHGFGCEHGRATDLPGGRRRVRSSDDASACATPNVGCPAGAPVQQLVLQLKAVDDCCIYQALRQEPLEKNRLAGRGLRDWAAGERLVKEVTHRKLQNL